MFSKGLKTTSSFGRGDKIHFIGIKGVGMTALAQILTGRGCVVTGSDGPARFFTDEVLRRLKIPFTEKFDENNIPANVDMVISSAAYLHEGKSLGNREVDTALKRKLTIYSYPQALGILAKDYKVIAVAGSHGKSTTTALLGWVLEKAGLDPTVIVGTKVNKWESNARVGKSEWLVLEADEYREAFLNYKPFGVILTSIDYDHPDYFKTPADYEHAFNKLINTIDPKGFLVACRDDAQVNGIAVREKKQGRTVVTYGFKLDSDVFVADKGIVKSQYQSKARYGTSRQQMFHIVFTDKHFALANIAFPGKQYIANAAAALATARLLKADRQKSVAAVASFPGTARRLEILKKPTKDEPAMIIDDYAHHPTAIKITLEGIAKMYPKKKLIVVFQPHMFSRTAALLDDFAKSFTLADEVGLMEIYPSAREVSGPVSGKDLATKAKQYHKRVTYLKDMDAGKQFVKQFLKHDCVIVLMGAGDVNRLAECE